jgi:hypothetical protein
MRLQLTAVLALLALAACSSENEPKKVGSSSTPTAQPGAQDAVAPKRVAKSITFVKQDGWVEEKPTSAMRKAQYKLPKQGTDIDDAELNVIFLGTDGGGLEANLDRWAGQFKQPDGGSSRERMLQSERTVLGWKVVEVDLSGTYDTQAMPGMGEQITKPGWRMLMSWIQSDHGNYFVKTVGPASTVAHWQASVRKFVDDAKAEY